MKRSVTIIPTDLVTNSLLSSLCLFLQTKNKIRFSASWWSGNEKYFCFFCLQRVALYFKVMPNLINFYEAIFLHVIPFRIIVPWYTQNVVTRNKFTLFRPWKLENLTLLTVKENLYTNLLLTIISSLANKNYYYIVISFLCYVFCFASKGFVFPLLS